MTELLSDVDLIAAVRRGDTDAYGQLYERHLSAAKRAALVLAQDAAAREDLVADAFARVLSALRAGNGPRLEFRAYLLVTMRNAAISTTRATSESLYAEVPDRADSGVVGDPVLDRWHASAAADAFASLPERWRMVLWHTEIEDESPASIAPRLGLRPNGVAALAYRAREGLRQAYLKAHLGEVEAGDCRATVTKLAGWVRNSGPLGRRTTRHLASCPECRARADTLSSVNNELRASVAPLLLLVGYLPAHTALTGLKAAVTKVAAAAVLAATAATSVSSTAPTVLAEQPVPVLPAPARGETVSTVTVPVTAPRSSPPAAPPPAAPPPQTVEEPAPATPAPSAEPATEGESKEKKDKKDKKEKKEKKEKEKGG